MGANVMPSSSEEDLWEASLLPWASRITRHSPPYSRWLVARMLRTADYLQAALDDLESGSLVRRGRDGL